MPAKTKSKKETKVPAIPADKTPDCPPHLWHVFQDGSAYCKKCTEKRPAGTFPAWLAALDAPSMNYSVHRGFTQNGRAYYRPVVVFKL